MKVEHADKDEVILGRINGVFGIRGEVRLFLYNPLTDLLMGGADVVLRTEAGVRRKARLSSRPGAGKRVLGRIAGVTTPEAARALMGADIIYPKALLPELEEDTYYHHEIIGIPVETESGELLGTLQEIVTSGNVDLWVVRGHGTEAYIPAVGDEIVSVEPGVKIIVADG
ncbi:MAG: 16S rRNA processing protein RimM [Myxococcota bacterium]|jgi:16S rRNA processing protein RimM